MRAATFEFLRCPYCGGRLELVESLPHRRLDDDIVDGIIACHCCIFPVVDGIPVMHLLPSATTAREHLEAKRPDLARRVMFGLEDPARSEAFDRVAASPHATYKETVEAFGPNFEGGYFLYRFSDPTFVVADAVVNAVAGTVLAGGGRAIDICGGSGHLTRSLLALPGDPPVLADLYYAKVWLARRFTAPGCEPVCCDGNAPLPFARGAFRFAMCTDAFMYIWTKRQFVGEMERLIDSGDAGPAGAVVIGHTHNARTWSPSHGQPLPPEAYGALFETTTPRLFAEGGLFADLLDGGALDLSCRDTQEILEADPALTIVASRHGGVFQRHARRPPGRVTGEFRLNPLYRVEPVGAGDVRLRLHFPDPDYEEEYGACRRYLPEEATVARVLLDALPAATLPPGLAELAERRVVLYLPVRYY
ncbi:MAG TPA: hypothetical protein VF219_08910 [Vicinamibacterales bacterium]